MDKPESAWQDFIDAAPIDGPIQPIEPPELPIPEVSALDEDLPDSQRRYGHSV